MKPKKIAVMYDYGEDYSRNLGIRMSIIYDPVEDKNSISVFMLKPNGETAESMSFELTPEIADDLREILNNKRE